MKLTLEDVKIRLEIDEKDTTSDKLIKATMEDVIDFVIDYLYYNKIEDIPNGLKNTIVKMIQFNLCDIKYKRQKIKDVDTEFNTSYPPQFYKILNSYKRALTPSINDK